MSDIPRFETRDWQLLTKGKDDSPERGQLIFIVQLDRDTSDFDHLIAKDIEVNGLVFRCVGVDRFAHSSPWFKGETIGLAVVLERRPSYDPWLSMANAYLDIIKGDE